MVSFLKRLSFFLLEDDINKRKKTSLSNRQTLYTTVGSLLVTIVGYLGITKQLWLCLIAIVLLVVTGVAFCVFWFALESIENREQNDNEMLTLRNNELLEEKNALEKKNTKLTGDIEYYTLLWSETSLLSQAISKANYERTTKGLYSKLTNSVIQLMSAYLPSIKENYAVHIYVFDGSTKYIRRVDVQSHVNTKQGAVENEPRPISDNRIKNKYYVKAITHKREKIFTLFDNEAIRKAFSLENEDEEISKQYTQYMAMRYSSRNQMRILVEVIAYNGLRFAENEDDLKTCVKKIIAPFANLFSSVDWAAISQDVASKGGDHDAY